jgi:RluA family pseudouridine synthase
MIPILYRDDDCVAVLKPCGVAAVPERSGDVACLSALLGEEVGRRVLPVHRLDKEVGGVILYAFTPEAHRFLNLAFERREVSKTYLAVVHGVLLPETGVIDRALREFGSGRMGVDGERGKPSLTRYEVMQTRAAYSLVRLHPETGRRHQLRVHLYSLGHPIAGDRRYGSAEQRGGGHPRLMLAATGLALRLPAGGRLELSDIVPLDFSEALRTFYALPLPACFRKP